MSSTRRSSCGGMLRLALVLCLAAATQNSAQKAGWWSPQNLKMMGAALKMGWEYYFSKKQKNQEQKNKDNDNDYHWYYKTSYYYYYNDVSDTCASGASGAGSWRDYFNSGPKQSEQQNANVYGDPEVCCVWNGKKDVFEKIYVYGPFSTVCLNPNGTAHALEFIGLCDEDQRNCQSPKAYHVAEIWHFDLSSFTWKHKDLRSTIGGLSNRHKFCEGAWNNVPPSAGDPPEEWFQAFQQGRSFFVWKHDPHSAIEGPKGEFLTNLFSPDGTEGMNQMIGNGTFAGDDVGELVEGTLRFLQYDSGEDPDLRQKLASYVAIASVVLGFKGRASPAGF